MLVERLTKIRPGAEKHAKDKENAKCLESLIYPVSDEISRNTEQRRRL